MSRIGKKPIDLPAGVKVAVQGNKVSVTGPKGTLTFAHANGVKVAHDASANALKVDRASDSATARALHGTTRAILNNLVVGVTQGYSQKMEVYGTGYTVAVQGQSLDLKVGYSHLIKIPVPAGIKVTVEVAAAKGDDTPAKLTVEGIDKEVVGRFCRAIKDARHPEPYKGKGVRYEGEQILRKAGKAFAGAGG
ncbi:MAG: 50S ribosomal protein L6 [Phycisphaerae bacterium]|nr:50S ribosomal protein L6 [Phycisphaerae bacterium]